MSPIQTCGWLWIAWGFIWILWAFQSRQTRQREGLASQIYYRIPIFLAIYLIYARRHSFWTSEIFPYHSWLGWLGVAITALGFAFTLWARTMLGTNWSGAITIKVGHELIRTGPYRFVRHPIYTGILVAAVGSALAYDRWRGLVALPILWLAFTVKRHKEEQFMRQTFGAQYDDYARTTGAIFPIVPRSNALTSLL